jgi:hypothetical protein
MSRAFSLLITTAIIAVIASPARSDEGYPARPLGVWERVLQKDDEAGKVTFYILPQRIHWTIVDAKTRAGLLLSGDYSVTKDSVLYGVLSSVEPYVDGKTDIDPDQMFRFRFRIDGEYLTVKDFNMPGQSDAKVLMAGRYKRIAVTAKDPEPPQPVKVEASLPPFPMTLPSSAYLVGGVLGTGAGALLGANKEQAAELLPPPKIESDNPR